MVVVHGTVDKSLGRSRQESATRSSSNSAPGQSYTDNNVKVGEKSILPRKSMTNWEATDIFNPQLKEMREQRWHNAFYTSVAAEEDLDTINNCKATIVIEHIILASDVSHTMQHWHVYNNWNERLFCEMYMAYLQGQTDKDPSVGWYMGELWFFDNYIIPLVQKLEECGVFGVSSDEYLIYAKANRQEWEKKGKEIVQENLMRLKQANKHRRFLPTSCHCP